ncbi:MAG: hypothetical protein HS116_20370 [Planctomycetes bacterium]|nr:hypothetical protein [Planctomycetota bacterium]
MRPCLSSLGRLLIVGLLVCGPAYAQSAGDNLVYTYTSPVDNTLQPYGVYLPTGWSAGATGETRFPAVIYLHGWSGRLRVANGTEIAAANTRGWILCFPDGRGSINYDHVGEDDILTVRQRLIDDFGAHPEKIYLCGFSMGGHGTYRLGCRFPHLFAACRASAGWTDYFEFYPHWYEQETAPLLTAYLDPTRAPLLGHTAALPQVENGLGTAWRVHYGTADTTNPKINAERMIDAWQALNHPDLTVVSHGGGHNDEALTTTFPFFDGKRVDPNRADVVYRTWRLRHDGAYWITVNDFRAREQQARLRAVVASSDDRIDVEAENVERFTLAPPEALLPAGGEVEVFVNGDLAWTGTWDGNLTLETTRDGGGFPDGWAEAGAPLLGAFKKVKGLEGPITDTSRGPFVVIYGTGGGDPDRVAENLKAAQLFCGQWNAMCVLRWGGGAVPADWYEPPYPFATGAYMSGNNGREVLPISDTDAALLDLTGKNKILFGDPGSNPFIATAYGPLTLHTDLEGGGITVGTRTYGAATHRYCFCYPDANGTLTMVSKGFNSSLPELNWSPFDLAKDFEQWPWLHPDYVVWDTARAPTGIFDSDSTYRYLPETWVEAGFFNADWELDETPPALRVGFDGTPVPGVPGTYSTAGSVTAEAADEAGGSGVGTIEYRIGTGAWQTYTGPIAQSTGTALNYEFRAADRGLSWLYEAHPTTGFIRATQALNNASATQALDVTVDPGAVAADGFVVRKIVGTLASPNARRQPGDTITFTVDLGADLIAGGIAEKPLSVIVGTLAPDPVATDARGRIKALLPDGSKLTGRIVVNTRVRRLTLKLWNVDLEAALGIAPGDLAGIVNVPLTLVLDGVSAGPIAYGALLTRRKPAASGRLKYIEGRVP